MKKKKPFDTINCNIKKNVKRFLSLEINIIYIILIDHHRLVDLNFKR